MPEFPNEIELDPLCIHDGCAMKGTITLCFQFYTPGNKKPVLRYANAALCEYHRWPVEAVEAFMDDNWEALTGGFGLGILPERDKVRWFWAPWIRAVEFWRKLQAVQDKKATVN